MRWLSRIEDELAHWIGDDVAHKKWRCGGSLTLEKSWLNRIGDDVAQYD